MIDDLILNTLSLLAINLVYIIFPQKTLQYSKIKSIFIGCLLSVIGIGIMCSPYRVTDFFLDVRAVLIGLTGLFFGFIPTAIVTVATSLFRAYQGGIGTWSDIGISIVYAVIALLWRHFRFKQIIKKRFARYLELLLFGIVLSVVTIAFMAPVSWQDALAISIPILIVIPIGTLFIGMIFIVQIDIMNTNLQLQKCKERISVTLLSVGDGVITTDEKGNITLMNKAAEEITGWTNSEVVGKPIQRSFTILNQYTREKVEGPVQKVLESGKKFELANNTVIIRKDGSEKPIADSAAPIKDNGGNIHGVVLVIRDVTEERKHQQKITHLAYHDGLTGLYNRRFFDEELRKLNRTDENLPLSIIMGDVNGLKLTNDTFGHIAGDKLLQRIAEEIIRGCRKDDIVSRWGGDEFIVLLPKTDEKSAKTVCDRIKSNCAKIQMDKIDFPISLGYETKHDSNEDIMEIIKLAEDYMYRNKAIDSSSTRGNTANTILLALHEKNPREQMHSNRVSELCKKIGIAMELPEKDVSELGVVGLMHDIGKIAINENILNKKERLTDKEWTEIMRHPGVGYRILSASNSMAYIAKYVWAHHERLDGSGYPNGIQSSEIPIQSKILAIADSYDAMTSERPYKKILSEDLVIEELKNNSGTQFDPDIVKVFIEKVLHEAM